MSVPVRVRRTFSSLLEAGDGRHSLKSRLVQPDRHSLKTTAQNTDGWMDGWTGGWTGGRKSTSVFQVNTVFFFQLSKIENISSPIPDQHKCVIKDAQIFFMGCIWEI